MSQSNILKSILLVSEKAANIARAIRQEEHLLSLLVREKKEDEKNPRFTQDFKTLADVLVQEVVKHDLGSEFPELVGHIYGEESNEFSCLDGEVLCLCVGNTEAETCAQLVRILGDERAADTLTQLVHSPATRELTIPQCQLSTDTIGIWIDPIDSTAEYIAGGVAETDIPGVFSSGLPCVTVLIGAFQRSTGQPVLGVVNQPFHIQHDNRWQGDIVWGFSADGTNMTSIPQLSPSVENKTIVLSSSESSHVKDRLRSAGYTLLEAAGAGYKLYCVVRHLVTAYILSKPSTFYWDTCGVNAILAAQGGGMVSYRQALLGDIVPLTYTAGVGVEQCCNNDGFIAYTDEDDLRQIIDCLKPE